MSEDINSRVSNQIDKMSTEEKDHILQSFSHFTSFLKDQLAKGESLGLSDGMLAKATRFVADHLAKNEEPRNREEKVLNELWQAADEDEKKALSRVLVKMVQNA